MRIRESMVQALGQRKESEQQAAFTFIPEKGVKPYREDVGIQGGRFQTRSAKCDSCSLILGAIPSPRAGGGMSK